MNELNNAVMAALDKIETSGFVQEAIEDQLKKTIASIVNDHLKSYSDFGKALSENINRALSIDLKSITFVEYNKVLLNLVEGVINNAVTEDAANKFKKDLIELFGKPPKEIKLSDLIAQYISENRDDDPCSCDNENICLIIEKKDYDGWVGIALHPKNKKGYRDEPRDWNNCELYLSIKLIDGDQTKGKIIWVSDYDGPKTHQFMPTCLKGVSRMLYQMYCAGSVLIFDQGMDTDNYDTSYMDEY